MDVANWQSMEACAFPTEQRGHVKSVPVRDVPTMSYERVYVSVMVPHAARSCVQLKGVRINERKEESVSATGPRWHCVRWKDVGSKHSMEGCAGVMGGLGGGI